ncbi:MAG: hypothetical protein D6800_09780 [Candidatus Zixiibacteriota bacterium]|nr:MAG: hypothetical protein D6800_09780 [candidate division Zixibacteria bacterium]
MTHALITSLFGGSLMHAATDTAGAVFNLPFAPLVATGRMVAGQIAIYSLDAKTAYGRKDEEDLAILAPGVAGNVTDVVPRRSPDFPDDFGQINPIPVLDERRGVFAMDMGDDVDILAAGQQFGQASRDLEAVWGWLHGHVVTLSIVTNFGEVHVPDGQQSINWKRNDGCLWRYVGLATQFQCDILDFRQQRLQALGPALGLFCWCLFYPGVDLPGGCRREFVPADCPTLYGFCSCRRRCYRLGQRRGPWLGCGAAAANNQREDKKQRC